MSVFYLNEGVSRPFANELECETDSLEFCLDSLLSSLFFINWIWFWSAAGVGDLLTSLKLVLLYSEGDDGIECIVFDWRGVLGTLNRGGSGIFEDTGDFVHDLDGWRGAWCVGDMVEFLVNDEIGVGGDRLFPGVEKDLL